MFFFWGWELLQPGVLADGNNPVTTMYWGDCDTFPGFPEPSAEPGSPLLGLVSWGCFIETLLTQVHLLIEIIWASPFMKITLRTLPLLSIWISRITKSWTSTHTTYIPSLLKGWFCTFCPVFWQTLGHISGVVPQSPFYVSSGNHLTRAHG